MVVLCRRRHVYICSPSEDVKCALVRLCGNGRVSANACQRGACGQVFTSAFLFRLSASASVYSMSSTSSLPESSSEQSSSGRELLNSVGWKHDYFH